MKENNDDCDNLEEIIYLKVDLNNCEETINFARFVNRYSFLIVFLELHLLFWEIIFLSLFLYHNKNSLISFFSYQNTLETKQPNFLVKNIGKLLND